MSTTLITDTIDETTVKRDERGWYAVRTCKLLNVTGSPSAIVYNALQDALLTANNYNFGQVHPTLTALYCASVTGKAYDVNKVLITCEYRPFQVFFIASSTQKALLTIMASVQSTQTNLDINGKTMYVSPPSGYSDPITGTTANSGTVQVDTGLLVLSFSRREPAAPSAAVLAMQNTLNQYNANIAGSTYAPNTLKLDRIQAEPQDNGSGSYDYRCTYEFTYRPQTWQTTIVYQSSSGEVVTDGASPPNVGSATYWNYSTSDFSTLLLW